MLPVFLITTAPLAKADTNFASLQPKEQAQLFVDAFINSDPQSIDKLSVDQNDEAKNRYRSHIAKMAKRAALENAMINLVDFTKIVITKNPKLSKEMQSQLVAYANDQARTILNTRCHVTESKPMKACWSGQEEHVEVHLSCYVPNIPSWSPVVAPLKSLPASYFSELSSSWNGEAIKKLSVKMRFFSTDQGWELDSAYGPKGVIAAISMSLSPDAGPKSKARYVPGQTTTELNPCIYRDSTSFNNRYILFHDAFWKFATINDLKTVLDRYDNPLTLVYDDNSTKTAFHVALQNNASLPVMQALRNRLPHMPGLSGGDNSLLTTAIKAHNSPETIKWLIEEGAPVDELPPYGMRPLILAIMEGSDAKTIDLLVKSGADISYYNNTNYPDLDALRAAMQTKHTEASRAISKHLVIPEHGSELMQYLLTQLSYGVRYNPKYPDATSEILPVLIDRGLNLNETFCDTFRSQLCKSWPPINLMDLAESIDNPKLIDYFSKKGLKPSAK
jgi:hypothetical protein